MLYIKDFAQKGIVMWVVKDFTELVKYECNKMSQVYEIVEQLKEKKHEYKIERKKDGQNSTKV